MIQPSNIEYKTETLYECFSKTITGTLDTLAFQRPYVWPEEETEKQRLAAFSLDFIEFANIIKSSQRGERNNSLGQVVFYHESKTNTFKIIDGLQRLTSLCLFVEAIFYLYEKAILNYPESDRQAIVDDMDSDIKDFTKTITNKFKKDWKTQSKIKKSNNNYYLGYTKILELPELVDWFDPKVNKGVSLNKRMRLLLEAIQYSKLSFVCAKDRDTSINMFEQLNSGVPLEPYEFFKTKLASSTCKLNSKISDFDSLFKDNEDKPNEVNEDLLANCLNILPKVFSKDIIHTHIVPGRLKQVFLDTKFSSLVLDPVYPEGSFYDHCKAVKVHIDSINDFFNTSYGLDTCFNTKPVNKMMCLAFKATDFVTKREEYYKLFLLVEVLLNLPKPGPMSGIMWNDFLISLRKPIQEKKPLTITLFYSELRKLYFTSNSGWMRDSLIGINGKERFMEQRYASSQHKKLKRIFLLIETALNKNSLPAPSSSQIEHIDAKSGSNKIGNLLLLESNINQSIKDIDWKLKNTKNSIKQQYCYSDSIFWLPKMMFGIFPDEIKTPNLYLKSETQKELLNFVTQQVTPQTREAGTEHNLAILTDYAIQRILGV